MIQKLLVFTCFLISFGVFSQAPELFDNEWFLTEITQNGEVISIPDNDEISFVPLRFEPENDDRSTLFTTNVCNVLTSELDFNDEENTFTITFFTATLIVCSNPENIPFELDYFEFYVEEEAYAYAISEENDTKTLTITSPGGNDTATYTSTNLSTASAEKNVLQVYPNPATDQLILNAAGFSVRNIEIYTMHGRKINPLKIQKSTIDVSDLANGIYFMVVSDEKQRKVIKFIKN